MVDVFVSYARAERERVLPIKNALEREGLELFFDLEDIDGGELFAANIDQALKKATVVLACWSKLAFTRPWVLQENRVARARGVLIPISVAPFEELDVPAEFFGTHYINLTDFRGIEHAGWEQLLRALKKFGISGNRTAMSEVGSASFRRDHIAFRADLAEFAKRYLLSDEDRKAARKEWAEYSSLVRRFESEALDLLGRAPMFRSRGQALESCAAYISALTFGLAHYGETRDDFEDTTFTPIFPLGGEPFDEGRMEGTGKANQVQYCARPGLERTTWGGSRVVVLKAVVERAW